MKTQFGLIAKPNRMTNVVYSFFKKIGERIASLFEPEEVEVTFKVEGKTTRYTYTVVEEKQVA